MRSLSALTLALALSAGSAHGGFFPDNPFSDDARGLTSAQFLKTPPSARFGALAGAGLTLAGPDAFFLNPAGTRGAGAGLAVTYEALLEGSSRTGFVFSRPSAAGTFSAGFIYNNNTPGLESLDGAGGGSGAEITAYDAAFGREPYPSRTELALAVRNFGPPLRLGSEKAPLPFELAGGLKWKYTSDFNLLFEGRLPADHAPYLVFAGEWFLPYSAGAGLFLRSGLNFRNYDDHGAMGAFAGGFGLRWGGFTADYAFSPYGDLGSAHRRPVLGRRRGTGAPGPPAAGGGAGRGPLLRGGRRDGDRGGGGAQSGGSRTAPDRAFQDGGALQAGFYPGGKAPRLFRPERRGFRRRAGQDHRGRYRRFRQRAPGRRGLPYHGKPRGPGLHGRAP